MIKSHRSHIFVRINNGLYITGGFSTTKHERLDTTSETSKSWVELPDIQYRAIIGAAAAKDREILSWEDIMMNILIL